MPRRKKAIRYAKLGEKNIWHPYGLQGLTADRFASVVNRILIGRFDLLKRRWSSPLELRP